MNERESWYVKGSDGQVYGPADMASLVVWASEGRIEPNGFVSRDRRSWILAPRLPELEMHWVVETEPGKYYGPFNRQVVNRLAANGSIPQGAFVYRRHLLPVDRDPDPVRVEVPVEVEKIIEKRVEVPVEVEKIVEKIVEKVVVDESRVKELEGLLESERKHAAEQLETERRHAAEELDAARRHTAELQARMDAALKASAEREAAAQAKVVLEAREASARETKLREQVVALENEIRRLPQTASEIADIQAAVYSIMTNEANELGVLLEMERKDLDEFRRRHQERADRLQDRRRELLKRAGANIEDMTRRALINRPEDPRTAQLRKELDELRRLSERKALASEQQINDLKDRLRLQQTEQARAMEGLKDVTQLRAEAQALREKLQLREKELMSERQQNEAMRQQQAFKQQTLMTRLAALESPSIGTTQSLETNQSREAKLVKLPSWMRIHK